MMTRPSAIPQKVFLESTGPRVETFSTGQPVFPRVPFPEPGCAILDIDVPGVTGIEVLKSLVMNGIRARHSRDRRE